MQTEMGKGVVEEETVEPKGKGQMEEVWLEAKKIVWKGKGGSYTHSTAQVPRKPGTSLACENKMGKELLSPYILLLPQLCFPVQAKSSNLKEPLNFFLLSLYQLILALLPNWSNSLCL